MRSNAFWCAVRSAAVLSVAVGIGVLAQTPLPARLSGVMNDYSPATTDAPTGPWELRGPWTLTLNGAANTADFTATLTMEPSEYARNRMQRTYRITVEGGIVRQTTGGFEVTGAASVIEDGKPAPFVASTLTVTITGGTSIGFSNIALQFAGGAPVHFGSQLIHGVAGSPITAGTSPSPTPGTTTAVVAPLTLTMNQPSERAVVLTAAALIAPAAEPNPSDPKTLCPAAQSLNDCALRNNNLGTSYFSQGKYRDAEPLFARAIALWAANSAPSDNLATAYRNLAAVYRAEDRYSDSARFYRSALDLREALAGPSDSTLVPILNELGLVDLDVADYVRAERTLERAISIVRRCNSEQTTLGADVLNNLAMANRQLGRFADAEELYRRALAVYQHSSDAEREVEALNNLGAVLAEQARYKEAEHLYREAIALAGQKLGRAHPDVAIGLGNLAKLRILRGKYADAEPLLRRAEQIDRASFAADNVRIGYDLSNEAMVASERKRYADAEELCKQSESILEEALPPNHPELGKLVGRLANVYRLEGRLDESEALFRRALNILDQAWGPENPMLLNVLQHYEALLRMRQEYAEAESVAVRTTRIRVAEALRNSN
jgi:tetratricopeptide (TPR) repeat protein